MTRDTANNSRRSRETDRQKPEQVTPIDPMREFATDFGELEFDDYAASIFNPRMPLSLGNFPPTRDE